MQFSEVDFIVNRLKILEEKFEKKIAGALTSLECASLADELIREGTHEFLEGLSLAEKMKDQGFGVNDVKKYINALKPAMDGISSILYSSIYHSIKKSLKIAKENNEIDEMPGDQLLELESFFRRTDIYLKEREGVFTASEYNHIKDEIIRLDNAGKITGFGVLLSKIENEIGFEGLEKILNKGYKKYDLFLAANENEIGHERTIGEIFKELEDEFGEYENKGAHSALGGLESVIGEDNVTFRYILEKSKAVDQREVLKIHHKNIPKLDKKTFEVFCEYIFGKDYFEDRIIDTIKNCDFLRESDDDSLDIEEW